MLGGIASDRGLTHAGTAGDGDQLASAHPAECAVKVVKPGRQSVDAGSKVRLLKVALDPLEAGLAVSGCLGRTEFAQLHNLGDGIPWEREICSL